jgi:hypothetical protein
MPKRPAKKKPAPAARKPVPAPVQVAPNPRSSRALEGLDAVKAALLKAPPQVRELAETLRRLVKKAAPDARETGRPGSSAVDFEKKKAFCSITVHQDHVIFAFPRGADLDDPEKLLQGDGKGERRLRVARVSDIRGGAFERFVRQARDLAGR